MTTKISKTASRKQRKGTSLTSRKSGGQSLQTVVGPEVRELLHDAVTQLFQDARVEYRRMSARGQSYSIADDAYSEYVHWFDMPWK